MNDRKILDNKLQENECKDYNKLSHIMPKTKRIIAIGDLHGNLKKTIYIFKKLNLIDNKNEWIAIPKDTIVVQVGDILDSCREKNLNDCENEIKEDNERGDLSIFAFLNIVNRNAEKMGGKVICLLGNHELLNVMQKTHYNSRKDLLEINRIKGYEDITDLSELRKIRHKLFKPGGKLAKFMACTRHSALIIGSNLFVHAGVINKVANKYKIEDINIIVRKWLLNKINLNSTKSDIGTLKDILLNYDSSIFWTRLLGNLPSNASKKECDNHMKEVLKLWKIERMIVGHTPSINENQNIISLCDNRIHRIDTGIGEGFDKFKSGSNNKIELLEILNDTKHNKIILDYP